jgi:hypothetical protein
MVAAATVLLVKIATLENLSVGFHAAAAEVGYTLFFSHIFKIYVKLQYLPLVQLVECM